VIWDEFYKQFSKARRSTRPMEVIEQFMPRALDAVASTSAEDIEWLINGLRDGKKKWFVQLLCARSDILPEDFFMPLVRAAVYEDDPSYNRDFVDPCIRIFGVRRVSEALLNFVSTGTNFEKAGAVNALYWALGSPDNAEEIEDIYIRRRSMYLQEFVSNRNLHVRRSIIPNLVLDPKKYPENLAPLVEEAIRIARHHSDSYIRHRLQVELGQSKVLEPLPHRGDTKSFLSKLLDYFSSNED
jgi:hypothetical protein